jgi:hypothetical protein
MKCSINIQKRLYMIIICRYILEALERIAQDVFIYDNPFPRFKIFNIYPEKGNAVAPGSRLKTRFSALIFRDHDKNSPSNRACIDRRGIADLEPETGCGIHSCGVYRCEDGNKD